ncbi:hypothetical protein BDF22DRAFT_777330 [Syncephalis plumigaleata]|nr:hypothetical protein BDF22DRAFT_777330 [Syncephalis plumigaleata]
MLNLLVRCLFLLSALALPATPGHGHTQSHQVLIATSVCTRTHAHPMLETGQELITRGHHITYVAYDDNLVWSSYLSKVRQIGYGVKIGEQENIKTWMVRHSLSRNEWSMDDSPAIDVAVCDCVAYACMDAAHKLDIGLVISTISSEYFDYFRASYIPAIAGTFPITLEHMSFAERFYDKTVGLLTQYLNNRPGLRAHREKQLLAGVEPHVGAASRYDQALVLVGTFPGFEPPIAHGAHFLENRNRVAFMAFGTLAVISPSRYQKLVDLFTTAYNAGLLDGVIWAVVRTSIDFMPDEFQSRNIVTGKPSMTHSVKDMLAGQHPFIRMVSYAPQQAILKHPSVKLFVSHCGIASIHEAIEARVPILGVPVIGDQQLQAARVEHFDIGRRLQWRDVDTSMAFDKLSELVEGNKLVTIHSKIEQLARIAEISSRRLPLAADLVEMAAIPGAIRMLETPDKRMSWWRAHNIDVWLTVTAILIATLYTATYAVFTIMRKVYKSYLSTRRTSKLKAN